MSIGHIVEINEQTETACIEPGDRCVRVPREIYEYYQQLDFYNESVFCEDLKKWNELRRKGVFTFAHTMEALFEEIKNMCPTRQGVRYISEERAFVIMGNQPNEISNLQSAIWINANGKQTIEEIYLTVCEQNIPYPSDPIRDFVECVVGLVRTGTMFLRS